MKFLKNALPRFNSYITFVGRSRAREVLLRSSDRMLEDAGFSRELLESGVKAWPWHSPASSLPALNFNQTGVATAMRELQNYSEEERYDISTSKSGISEAVICDRNGSDNNRDQRKVA